jgi:gamma-glutamylcyclotransferase (GGCT)/AIG2-like uncharacterized protein YtfP
MPWLFSYGTLREERVQLATFGRALGGEPDELTGVEPSTAGPHANLRFNNRSDSRVSGMVFDVTDAELAAADGYERTANYTRRRVTLASGRDAWVYVHDEHT